MNAKIIILTVIAADHSGIVQQLSDTIRIYGGNWLESSLSRLGGQFVGVVSVSIAPKDIVSLQEQLTNLAEQGIKIDVHQQLGTNHESPENVIEIDVEANDRPGIVEEISTALANQSINVEKMTTRCESASMAGYNLFKARIKVAMQNNMTLDDLEFVLGDVSDDLMVEVIQ